MQKCVSCVEKSFLETVLMRYGDIVCIFVSYPLHVYNCCCFSEKILRQYFSDFRFLLIYIFYSKH